MKLLLLFFTTKSLWKPPDASTNARHFTSLFPKGNRLSWKRSAPAVNHLNTNGSLGLLRETLFVLLFIDFVSCILVTVKEWLFFNLMTARPATSFVSLVLLYRQTREQRSFSLWCELMGISWINTSLYQSFINMLPLLEYFLLLVLSISPPSLTFTVTKAPRPSEPTFPPNGLHYIICKGSPCFPSVLWWKPTTLVNFILLHAHNLFKINYCLHRKLSYV